MKRIVCFAAAIPFLLMVSGCQKQHPMNVKIDPGLERAEKIAVFPFLSSLLESDDPDGLATVTMQKYFTPALDARNDYTFISPGTVMYAIEGQEWQEAYRTFLTNYPRGGKIDEQFFTELADVLKADGFLVPVVDVWQKDEVDYQENASAATYAGATITIFDPTGQKVLFRATDENYIEGARSETSDRGIVSSAGRVRSDSGSKTYRAPPYEEVAILVVDALVESLPAR
jgi:hypothetical protein